MRTPLLVLLAAFLLFVPFGSAPLYLGPVKLDNLIGGLLALALGGYLLLGGRFQRPEPTLYLFAFGYFFLLFVSVVTSPAPAYSLGRYAIIGGYAFVALLVPLVFADRVQLVGRLMLWFALAAASVIWLAFALLGMSDWGRMTIPTWTGGGFRYFPGGWGTSADPNILGFGLMLSLLFALAVRRLPAWQSWPLTLWVVSAAFLTLSRTAFASLTLALLLAALLVWLPWLLLRPEAIRVRTAGLLRLMIGVVVAVPLAVFVIPLDAFAERLLGGDSVRLQLYREVLANWLAADGNLLTGVGFNMARVITDPHNIYLTALHDSGLLGLAGLLLFMLAIFLRALAVEDLRLRFYALTLFFYIALAGMTYWHTKTFWVTIMFVLLLCRLAERPSPSASRPPNPIPTR